MRTAGIRGVYRRRGRGCTRRDPAATPSDDLVNRSFNPTGPDRLWCMDVTEHPTKEGKVYLASDHGSQYTSWAFGRRLRAAGLLGSMGSIGDAYDNSVVESFFGTLQLELLDRQPWTSRRELALAIFEWIEAWYNPTRRDSNCAMLSPNDYEAAHTAAQVAAWSTNNNRPGNRGMLRPCS